MKVYGWQVTISRELAKRLGSKGNQARAFVAAESKAAVKRAMADGYGGTFNLGETRNTDECRIAMDDPGLVFVMPLDGPDRTTAFRLDRYDHNVRRA